MLEGVKKFCKKGVLKKVSDTLQKVSDTFYDTFYILCPVFVIPADAGISFEMFRFAQHDGCDSVILNEGKDPNEILASLNMTDRIASF